MVDGCGDVIVAPASGAGRAAVAVVRLSGAGAAGIVGALSGRSIGTDRRMRLAWLRRPSDGRLLDQAMVVAYPHGSSFTGEESAEIYCHGGRAITDSIIAACMDLGAVPAGPGDFTRRAVANGRLDLVQAEAVALLSESGTEAAVDVAVQALRGESSARLAGMTSDLLDMLAECEAALDFDESDDVYVDLSGLSAGIAASAGAIDRWIRDARSVRPAVSGFRVVLSGPPNVGKSTLFNALTGCDRAIVHHEPGTTRDVITESITLGGIECVLFDTAGVRAAGCDVESEGVRRAIMAAGDADLVLHVTECGAAAAGGPGIDADSGEPGRLHALVLSKCDLAGRAGGPLAATDGFPSFAVSAQTGSGVPELVDFVSSSAAAALRSASRVAATVAGERQTNALIQAGGFLRAAAAALDCDAPLEVVASSIRDALNAIGEITGDRITEEVLDRIFRRFCIGK